MFVKRPLGLSWSCAWMWMTDRRLGNKADPLIQSKECDRTSLVEGGGPLLWVLQHRATEPV